VRVPGGARISLLAGAHRASAAALAAATLLVLAPSAVASASSSAFAAMSGPPGGAGMTLSNLRTLSRWAYPQFASAVHQDPSAGSRVVARLKFLTSDGQAEIYLALRSEKVGKVTWIQISVPARPNGITGWVPAAALSEMHISREYLRINRETLRAALQRNGRAIWGAPVGVGRPSLPTPAGNFYVTEKLITLEDPFYGPYALGTSAYAPTLGEWPGGGVIGIHGTDEPQLIPGRPSHGCIRLHNSDITKLWRLIEIGTPIEVV
jgi:L,D-transpeptidase catalytic domain